MITLLVQTAATWFMAGSIWTMQVLNYPLLARVGADAFVDYETAHNARFVRVVGPPVVVVVATTVWLFLARPDAVPLGAVVLAAALVVTILVLTAAFQAPAHTRLARGFDAGVHARLVRSNAARAAVWTLLGVVDLWMLTRMVP